MNVSIRRPTALGAAAALVLGVLAAVPAAAPASAAGPTTLTAAEAKAALARIVARTTTRGLREGMRQTTTTVRPKDSRGWTDWTETLVVDPVRHRVRVAEDVRAAPYGVVGPSSDPCTPEFSRDATPRDREIYQEGVGVWRHLEKSANERAGLRLLGKSKRIAWSETPKADVRVAGVVRARGLSADFDTHSAFILERFTGGSVEATPGGRRYVIRYADQYYPKLNGVVTFEVAADGSMSKAHRTEKVLTYSGKVGTMKVDYATTYGARVVALPSRKHVIAKTALNRGCRAALARTLPYDFAKDEARFLNVDVAGRHHRVTVAEIRREGRDLENYGADVRVVKIRYGIAIVGRDPLLKGRYVSTLFVSDGKAVAHRVR